MDNFIYYSNLDEVEQWFEKNLQLNIKVDFMGDVQWFLGQQYEWMKDQDGKLSCHIPQQAFVEGMLQKFQLQYLKPTDTPYVSGYKIDRIKQMPVDPRVEKEFTQKYQSLIGYLNWLSVNTRPDINTAYSLLSQFNSKPSPDHWDSAKHVLKYLKSTMSYGI